MKSSRKSSNERLGYYQGGESVLLLTPQGSNSLENWKRIGKVTKVFDKPSRGYVFSSTGGTCSKLQWPGNSKLSYSITHPFLVLQTMIDAVQSYSIEITVLDSGRAKRRLVLSTAFRDFSTNSLHAQLPLGPNYRNQWVDLTLDLNLIVEACFSKQQFRTLEAITVHGSHKLRRIYTLQEAPNGGPVDYLKTISIPRSVAFPNCGILCPVVFFIPKTKDAKSKMGKSSSEACVKKMMKRPVSSIARAAVASQKDRPKSCLPRTTKHAVSNKNTNLNKPKVKTFLAEPLADSAIKQQLRHATTVKSNPIISLTQKQLYSDPSLELMHHQKQMFSEVDGASNYEYNKYPQDILKFDKTSLSSANESHSSLNSMADQSQSQPSPMHELVESSESSLDDIEPINIQQSSSTNANPWSMNVPAKVELNSLHDDSETENYFAEETAYVQPQETSLIDDAMEKASCFDALEENMDASKYVDEAYADETASFRKETMDAIDLLNQNYDLDDEPPSYVQHDHVKKNSNTPISSPTEIKDQQSNDFSNGNDSESGTLMVDSETLARHDLADAKFNESIDELNIVSLEASFNEDEAEPIAYPNSSDSEKVDNEEQMDDEPEYMPPSIASDEQVSIEECEAENAEANDETNINVLASNEGGDIPNNEQDEVSFDFDLDSKSQNVTIEAPSEANNEGDDSAEESFDFGLPSKFASQSVIHHIDDAEESFDFGNPLGMSKENKTNTLVEPTNNTEVSTEESIEVLYDPILKCYYDPQTNKYYEMNAME